MCTTYQLVIQLSRPSTIELPNFKVLTQSLRADVAMSSSRKCGKSLAKAVTPAWSPWDESTVHHGDFMMGDLMRSWYTTYQNCHNNHTTSGSHLVVKGVICTIPPFIMFIDEFPVKRLGAKSHGHARLSEGISLPWLIKSPYWVPCFVKISNHLIPSNLTWLWSQLAASTGWLFYSLNNPTGNPHISP